MMIFGIRKKNLETKIDMVEPVMSKEAEEYGLLAFSGGNIPSMSSDFQPHVIFLALISYGFTLTVTKVIFPICIVSFADK